MSTYETWYQSTYPYLTRYGLWLRGPLRNQMNADLFEKSLCRLLIARLSTFEDTKSSITHQVLYGIAKKIPGLFADFSFLPPPLDATIFDRDRIPWLLGAQTKRGALDFDCIALSVSIVQEFLNLPTLLQKSNITLNREKRLEESAMPLVILGGASAACSSLICGNNSLVDGIFIGDSPSSISKIFSSITEHKKAGATKKEMLEALCEIEGFFCSNEKRPVWFTTENPLTCNDFLVAPPLFPDPETSGKSTLQLSEGCPAFCSFCAESWYKKPYREVSAYSLLNDIRKNKAACGSWEIDLYSFNFSMHRELYTLLAHAHTSVDKIGLKSQRLEMIAHDSELLPILHACNKSSITFGLEGISHRLRKYLAKSLSDLDISAALVSVFSNKVRELKIFLIVTGLEEDNDIQELGAFVDTINTLQETHRSHVRILFSATPIVRFPFTPLANERCTPPSELKKILGRIGSVIRSRGAEFRTACTIEESFVSQALLRPIHPDFFLVIMETLRETGFIYYREMESFFYAPLIRNLEKLGITQESILAEIDPSVSSPFLPITLKTSADFINQCTKAAQLNTQINFCLGTTQNKGTCQNCGACQSVGEKKTNTAMRTQSPYTGSDLRTRITDKKKKEKPFRIAITIPKESAGVPRIFLGSALISALISECPQTTDFFGPFLESFFSANDPFTAITGDDIISLSLAQSHHEMVASLITNDVTRANINVRLGNLCCVSSHSTTNPQAIKLSITSPYPYSLNAYLDNNHLKYTITNTGTQEKKYQFTPQSQKKKILDSLTWHSTPDDLYGSLSFIIKEKFNYREFCSLALALPDPLLWVSVSAKAQFL